MVRSYILNEACVSELIRVVKKRVPTPAMVETAQCLMKESAYHSESNYYLISKLISDLVVSVLLEDIFEDTIAPDASDKIARHSLYLLATSPEHFYEMFFIKEERIDGLIRVSPDAVDGDYFLTRKLVERGLRAHLDELVKQHHKDLLFLLGFFRQFVQEKFRGVKVSQCRVDVIKDTAVLRIYGY